MGGIRNEAAATAWGGHDAGDEASLAEALHRRDAGMALILRRTAQPDAVVIQDDAHLGQPQLVLMKGREADLDEDAHCRLGLLGI